MQARTQGGSRGFGKTPFFLSLLIKIHYLVGSTYATVNMITPLLISHDRLKLAIALPVPVVKLDPFAVVREQPLLDTAKVNH